MEEEKKEEPKQDADAAKTPEAAEPAEEVAAIVRSGKAIKPEELKAGMTIRVHEKIKDITAKGEERERLQVFEGIILGVRGARKSKTMTIRKESGGWGVEKIFPLFSPIIDHLELVKTAKTRRAKLSFLSEKKMKFKRRLKEKWVE